MSLPYLISALFLRQTFCIFFFFFTNHFFSLSLYLTEELPIIDPFFFLNFTQCAEIWQKIEFEIFNFQKFIFRDSK